MKILVADDLVAKSPSLRSHFGAQAKVKGRAKRSDPAAGQLVVSCAPRKRAGKAAKVDCACSGLDLGDQPEQAAAVLDALGIALLNRGCNAEGGELIEHALKIRRKAFGPNHPATAASLNSYARLLRERGDYAGAEAAARDALRINRAVFGRQGLPVAISLNELGVIQLNQSRFQEAESTALEGLAILNALGLSATDRNTTRLMDIRGRAEDELGKSDAASATFTELLALDRKQLGTTHHPKYATHLANFAGVKEAQKKFKEAEKYYREAIDLYFKGLNRPCHPNLIDTYANLANLLRKRPGDAAAMKEAGVLFLKALQLDVQVRGDAHEFVGNDYANLGRWQYDNGAAKEAVQSFSRALSIYGQNVKRGRFAADHVFIAEALTWKGRILVESGRGSAAAQAEPLVEQAVALWPVHLGANTVGEGIARACLGYALLLQNKDLGRAAQLLRQGYEIVLPVLGAENALTKRIAEWLAKLPSDAKAM
jgi:tetratricopeptide (TPR) repeat protein